MAMTMEEAVAKAAKLMKLAQSDNPNEAALAAARAQDIIDRYKLSGVDLSLDPAKKAEADEPIRGFEAPLHDSGTTTVATWRGRLALVCAKANQCHVYAERGVIKLVGRASDADAVRYLFAYLNREIERLSARDAKGNGLTWANNYRNGCVDTICVRLQEQRRATAVAVTAENPSAIVLVSNALARMEERTKQAEQWAKKNLNLRSRAARSAVDHGARAAGREAAKEVAIGGGKGLGGGFKGIGSGT